MQKKKYLLLGTCIIYQSRLFFYLPGLFQDGHFLKRAGQSNRPLKNGSIRIFFNETGWPYSDRITLDKYLKKKIIMIKNRVRPFFFLFKIQRKNMTGLTVIAKWAGSVPPLAIHLFPHLKKYK